MNRSRMFLALAVAATILTSSRGGQAADTPDLVTTGKVRVEDAKGASLTNVHVHQEEEQLVIWGMLATSSLPGHVDVTLLTSERQTIAETQVVPTVVLRARPGGLRWRFDAKLPVSPPSGTIVKIGYGFGHHETSQTGASDETGE